MLCPDIYAHVYATFLFMVNNADTSKVKAIPLQALTGPQGSGRFRLPDFKTIDT
jgi:hypothetical protein